MKIEHCGSSAGRQCFLFPILRFFFALGACPEPAEGRPSRETFFNLFLSFIVFWFRYFAVILYLASCILFSTSCIRFSKFQISSFKFLLQSSIVNCRSSIGILGLSRK